ncbi:MAG: 6-bladed beta-propeller [Bacteroidota bacterium]
MMKRRTFLQNSSLLSAGAVTVPSFFHILKREKASEDVIIGHGDFRYKVHKNWAKIGVVGVPLLNCHEMVMDRKGRLLMVGDHPQNNILVFDNSGKLLDAWGTEYPGGHGLTLAEEGEEDVLFIVDCGWFQKRDGSYDRQQGRVVKTDINGKLIFSIGHPRTFGAYEAGENYQPTEVAVAPNGDIYIADGYGSDYILQFNHDGEFIRKFGGKKNENPNYNLNNAHGVAIDQRDKDNPMLVVTSRNDYSFKYFTLEGQYSHTVNLPGAFVCRPVFNDNNLYAGVCWSETEEGKRWHPNTGFITILDKDNRVVSNPGGTAPMYKDGKLQQLFQAKGAEKVFHHGHDVCVDGDKNLYVCQWNANKTPPIKLERV